MDKDSDQVIEIGEGAGNSSPLLGPEAKLQAEDGNGKAIIAVAGLNDGDGDGAEEKLVMEERPSKLTIQPSKELGEVVKFNLADSQNGDAKIDIESVKIAFAGMGKQELMKFANDPFWIRVRWILFVMFWLIWTAMLVGAIAIIIVAPKCSSPAPLLWWEQSPLYQVYVPSFKDGAEPQDGDGDLKGLLSKVDYISDLGVKGLTISTILKASKNSQDDTIEDFQEVDSVYGSLGDFKALISAMKAKGMHLVMSFILNHSSNKHPWFVQSEKNEAPFNEYYVWAPASSVISSEGVRSPPNNWLSVQGGSAWEWSEARQMYYLHQFRKDQPDMNFHNPAVIAEFKSILEFWLGLGVSGFQFEKVQHLLEDIALKNESPGFEPGKIHDEYGFYNHHQTTNLPEVLDILSVFKQVVRNYTGDDGFVTVTGSIPAISISDFLGNTSSSIVDLPQNAQLFTQLQRGYSGADVYRRVQQWLEVGRCSWQLGDLTSHRVTSRLSADDVDGLNMVVMLLPGTPITQYGEEIGMDDSTTPDEKLKGRVPMSWSNTSNAGFSDTTPWLPVAYNYETVNVFSQQEAEESHLKVYKALVDARKSPSIMYGVTGFNTTANDTVFTYSRIKSGNPGYVVAFNTGEQDVVADLTVLKDVAGELTVTIRSSNIKGNALEIKSKWPAEAVPIPPKAAVVLTFVPKKD